MKKDTGLKWVFSALSLALLAVMAIPFGVVWVDSKMPTRQTNTQQLQADRDKAYRLIEKVFRVGTIESLTYAATPVTVSAYTARAGECDSTPEVTADMTPSRIGLLAVSRDLRTEIGLQFGDVVLLADGSDVLGVFQIRDVMNKRYRRRVDILHGNVEAARLFGVRENVTLTWIIGKRG